jgi:hypothetical protein
MAKNKKNMTEKPPPIDKLLKPAIGVVIAFVAYYFMKGISTEVSSFLQVDSSYKSVALVSKSSRN